MEVKPDHHFRNWDVAGSFTPEIKDGGITLHRHGDLKAYPVDKNLKPLTSHTAEQAGTQKTLVDDLTKKADQGRGFPNTIEIKKIEPAGDLAKAGPLVAQDFIPKDGWLTITWNRE
jgi:hypothetical protein